ncbi:MAG: ATP-binding protein [Terriglobia bacterium]
MTRADFVGNSRVVSVLWTMLASGRLPHALLFTGPKGVGKFTLATLFARAVNCESNEGDACGSCNVCRALTALDNLPGLVRAAQAARGSASPDSVPLILRPHPSVSVLVPDGAFIRVNQMRYVVRQAYTMPAGTHRNLFLIDQAEKLRFDYADVLLKVLEEPPEHTTLILVTDAPFELRSTIRSRCIQLFFAPLARSEIETYLASARREWTKADQQLAAALAAGSLGKALSLDFARTRETRRAALELLRAAVQESVQPESLFGATAALAGKGSRIGTEAGGSQEGFAFSLDILYTVFTDLVYLKVGVPDLGLHHPEIGSELQALSRRASWQWLSHAVTHLDQVKGWQRRNVNRQLALDAWALGWPESFSEI